MLQSPYYYETTHVKYLLFYLDRASSASSQQSAGIMGAERTFLTPKHTQSSMPANVPSLDEFDAEIEIYRVGMLSSNFMLT